MRLFLLKIEIISYDLHYTEYSEIQQLFSNENLNLTCPIRASFTRKFEVSIPNNFHSLTQVDYTFKNPWKWIRSVN